MALTFDATTTGNTSTDVGTLTYSHTIGSGSNRILIVAVSVESDSANNCIVQGVTYNAVAMTQSAQITAFENGFGVGSSIWYMDEANLPSAGANDVVVSATDSDVGGSDDINSGSISFSDAGQSGEEASETVSGGATNSLTDDITTLTDDAVIINATHSGNAGQTTSPGSGQTERWDFNGTSSHMGGGEEEISSAGTETQAWTLTNSNRHAMCLAAFPPFIATRRIFSIT